MSSPSEGFGHVLYLQGPVHPCRDMSVADRDLLGCFQKRREDECRRGGWVCAGASDASGPGATASNYLP